MAAGTAFHRFAPSYLVSAHFVATICRRNTWLEVYTSRHQLSWVFADVYQIEWSSTAILESHISTACLPAFSRPRYEGWPHHEHSFSIDICLSHFLLVLSVTTQSTILCCLSMSSWVYLECGSLGLYLVFF